MGVEGRQGIAFGHQRHTALGNRQGPEQAEQRTRCLHHDTPPARHGGRNVADELDRVPEALLGMDEEGSASRLLPLPQRLREGAARRLEPLLAQPPRVIVPAAGQVSAQQPGQRAVPMGAREVRVARHGPAVGRDRLVQPPQIVQAVAEVVQRLRTGWPEEDGVPLRQDGRCKTIQLPQEIAERGQGLGVGGLDRHGAPGGGGGLVQPPLLVQREDEVVQNVRVAGLDRQGAAKSRDPVIEHPLSLPDQAEIRQRLGMVGPDRQSPAVDPPGLLQPPLRVEAGAEVAQRLGKTGLEDQGLPVRRRRIRPPQSRQRKPEMIAANRTRADGCQRPEQGLRLPGAPGVQTQHAQAEQGVGVAGIVAKNSAEERLPVMDDARRRARGRSRPGRQ